MTLEQLTKDALSGQLNTKFRLSPAPERSVEVELVEIQDSNDVVGQTERFSAVFRGPLDCFLAQRTYLMEHERFGALEIFIVPIRQERDGFYYEAVFNRVK